MNTAQQTSSEIICKNIFDQLGGYNRLNIMIGIKDAMRRPNGVSFKIKFAGATANYVKITLNSMDLYDVEIGKIKGINYKVKETFDNVYADQLKGIIEKTCSVYLSL